MRAAFARTAYANHELLPSKKQIRGVLGIMAALALWQISVWIIALPAYFYPAPADVVA